MGRKKTICAGTPQVTTDRNTSHHSSLSRRTFRAARNVQVTYNVGVRCLPVGGASSTDGVGGIGPVAGAEDDLSSDGKRGEVGCGGAGGVRPDESCVGGEGLAGLLSQSVLNIHSLSDDSKSLPRQELAQAAFKCPS
jgi:hypothetical protein